jgi:hypothetical protein
VDYVRKGNVAARELREREDSSGWTEMIEQHLFRSRIAPIPWDGSWLAPLRLREAPRGTRAVEAFLGAAERLGDCWQKHRRFSLGGCLHEEIMLLHKKRHSFRVIVPSRRYRQDWLDLLNSCMNDRDPQEIENHLISAEQLHGYFQSVHWLILAGMVWERLAGSLHQVLTAPRWENVLHVRMQGTAIHPTFPDFLTTLPWEKKVRREGLYQRLSGQEHSEWTGLTRFHHEEITWEEPELAVRSEADPSTESILADEILPGNWQVEDREKAAHYSGLAFGVTTRSRHSLCQPLFRDGSRGGVLYLCPRKRKVIRTSLVTPGMLVLMTAPLKRQMVEHGGVDAGQWKQALRDLLKQRGEARVARELRGKIQLRNLKQALHRWARRSLLDAPRSKIHFVELWRYLELPDDQKAQAWKAIRLERRNATKRGQDWSMRKNSQIRKVLAGRLKEVSDVATLALENGGQDVYRDDRVRVFLSEVEHVTGEPIKRPFSRCNMAHRIKQE